MSQTKHPYADILIAIANCEPIESSYDYGKTWFLTQPSNVISRLASDDKTVIHRIKSKTIMINGHEVPEPFKVKPAYNTTYYYPSIGIYIDTTCNDSHWTDDVLDNERFNCGILHSTKEAAIKHAEALLSFTKVNE